jgi:hypothetical protein
MLMPFLLGGLVVNKDFASHNMDKAMLESVLGWCHQRAKGGLMRVHLRLR